jgi:hypothetical protein
MSEALDLIRAVLGEDCAHDELANKVLAEALEREVDPLLHCFAVCGIDQTLAMERSARWAGFAFYDKMPCGPGGRVEPTRLEALAGVRAFRMQVLDREIAFAAPDFFGLLRLKQKLSISPQLRQQVCLLPTAVLRDYLTEAASEALIVGARQGLARRWPYASAQLELTAPARYGFVVGLTILVVMVLLAPFAAEAWLLPAVLCLLVGPAVIRLAATVTPLQPEPLLRRPPDEELPVYSILIPLRSEAAMVPQLFEAMWALDYPALCIKRTNKRIAIGG